MKNCVSDSGDFDANLFFSLFFFYRSKKKRLPPFTPVQKQTFQKEIVAQVKDLNFIQHKSAFMDA